MPTLTSNQQAWQAEYNWANGGEEWSATWGDSKMQWKTCIFPRIEPFLPAKSIVEIGPGFGRWPEYLTHYCDSYVGVDLADRCVAACEKRFAGRQHIRFVTNDGLSLPTIPDNSVDFIFSFDSLVHANDDVIAAYLRDFRRVLNDDGIALIHHSNANAYRIPIALTDATVRAARRLAVRHGRIQGLKKPATQVGIVNWSHNRDLSMSSDRFLELSRSAGLACIGQEVLNWLGPLLIDCISIVTLPGSKWERPITRVINRHFTAAARASATIRPVYDF